MEGTRRRFRRAAIFLPLGNMLMGAIPPALAGPTGPLLRPATTTAQPASGQPPHPALVPFFLCTHCVGGSTSDQLEQTASCPPGRRSVPFPLLPRHTPPRPGLGAYSPSPDPAPPPPRHIPGAHPLRRKR